MKATTKSNLTAIFGNCENGSKSLGCTISGRTKKTIAGSLQVNHGSMTDLWVWTAQQGRSTQDVHARIDLSKANALDQLAACGVKFDSLVTTTYTVTDGNAYESADSLTAAAELVAEWYDHMTEDYEIPAFNSDAEEIKDIDHLHRLIRTWENAIAEANGHKAFHGHGNYSVSAASEMGLQLRVREDEAE